MLGFPLTQGTVTSSDIHFTQRLLLNAICCKDVLAAGEVHSRTARQTCGKYVPAAGDVHSRTASQTCGKDVPAAGEVHSRTARRSHTASDCGK